MESLRRASVRILPGILVVAILSRTLSRSTSFANKEQSEVDTLPPMQSLRRESIQTKSLFQSVAPLYFPIDASTGKISFPDAVETVAIDIGARESDYLDALERTVDERVALILFDPLPISFLPLQQRAAKYSLTGATRTTLDAKRKDRVFALHAAVGETEGTAQFHVADGPSCGSLLAATDKGAEAQKCARSSEKRTVMVFTLKDILDMLPDNLKSIHLKVDAEGADLSVLKGASSSIKRVSSVIIECQDLPPDDSRILRSGSCLYKDAAEYMCQNHGFCQHKFEVSGPRNRMGNVFFLSSDQEVDVPSYFQHNKIQFKEFFRSLAARQSI